MATRDLIIYYWGIMTINTKILFRKNGIPYSPRFIKRCVSEFGTSYNDIVLEIINRSRANLSRKIFLTNVAILMPNFLMTRQGPFHGLRYIREKDKIIGNTKRLRQCWDIAGKEMKNLKQIIRSQGADAYQRILVEMTSNDREELVLRLWKVFKMILPMCIGKSTLGLVAASKILFAIFPEVALPIDNTQWKKVFKTVDYSDIIMHMADEIRSWEEQTGDKLDSCVPEELTGMTLPAIYNVMAMRARFRERG